jgi:hypothetical protein
VLSKVDSDWTGGVWGLELPELVDLSVARVLEKVLPVADE